MYLFYYKKYLTREKKEEPFHQTWGVLIINKTIKMQKYILTSDDLNSKILVI